MAVCGYGRFEIDVECIGWTTWVWKHIRRGVPMEFGWLGTRKLAQGNASAYQSPKSAHGQDEGTGMVSHLEGWSSG